MTNDKACREAFADAVELFESEQLDALDAGKYALGLRGKEIAEYFWQAASAQYAEIVRKMRDALLYYASGSILSYEMAQKCVDRANAFLDGRQHGGGKYRVQLGGLGETARLKTKENISAQGKGDAS